MDAETRPREFLLGRWVWLPGVGVSLLSGAIGMPSERGDPAFLAGAFLGGAIAALGIAAFLAWLAWRLTGRSLAVARTAFAIGLVLPLLGQVARLAGNAVDRGAIDELVRIQGQYARQLAAAITPELTAADVPAAIASLDSLFEPAERRAGAAAKVLIRAVREHQRDTATRELTYAAALQAFIRADATNLQGAATAEERMRRRTAIQGLVDAGRVYRTYLEERVDRLRARLADVRGFDEFVAGIIKGATQSKARRDVALTRVLDARETHAGHLLALYDLLDRRAGAWRAKADGTIVFEGAEDLERFQAVAARVDEAEAKLVEFEAALVRAR